MLHERSMSLFGIVVLLRSRKVVIVTSTHTGWWCTIKEVEPTGEYTHNQLLAGSCLCTIMYDQLASGSPVVTYKTDATC